MFFYSFCFYFIHIIIINIDYEVNIGKIENFNNKKNNSKKLNKKENFTDPNNKSLDFLLENKDNSNDNEFIKKMKELSNSVENKKQKDGIIPSNGYLNNDNQPNFESDVNDTSKFYKIQNNYDNLIENQLQSTSLEKLNQTYNNISTEINKVENTVRNSQEKPAVWEYNNEFAMNGGSMNGIVGFDGLEGSYANFGHPMNMKQDEKSSYENIPHDDLRKPIVYND